MVVARPLRRVASAAGAVAGISQGLWRVARGQSSSASFSCAPVVAEQGSGAVPESSVSQSPARQLKPLLNVVVAGDTGAGTSSVAHALAGQPNTAQRADLTVLETEACGAPATVCLWHNPPPAVVALADACVLVYEPSKGAAAALETLEHWSSAARQAGLPRAVPLVVVATCSSEAGVQEAGAALAAAQDWCAQHDGAPHFAATSIHLAFEQALLLAVQRQQAEPGSTGAATANGLSEAGEAREESELGELPVALSEPQRPLLRFTTSFSVSPFGQSLLAMSSTSGAEESAPAVWPAAELERRA